MLTLTEPAPDLWERFQRGSLSAQDVAEEPILERWARARALVAAGASAPGPSDVATGPRRLRTRASWLARTDELLHSAAHDLRREGCALLLADAEGVIVRAFGADLFAEPEVRAGLAEGVRWHESERGTNAIGTALAERMAVAVVGGAHYEKAARGLACYAAPVCDAAGDIVAVLDISTAGSNADPRFAGVVRRLATAIESLLRDRPSVSRNAPGRRCVRFGLAGEYSGALVSPVGSEAPRGAVLVLHDVWGLDEHVEEVLVELAQAGYLALAPDLYARDGERPMPLSTPRLDTLRSLFDQDGRDDADRAAFDELFSVAAAREQLRILSSLHMVTTNRTLERHLPVALAALRFLQEQTPPQRVAVLGFAAGAMLSLQLAAAAREAPTSAAPLAAAILFDGNALARWDDEPRGVSGDSDEHAPLGCPIFAFSGERGAAGALERLAATMRRRGEFFSYRAYAQAGAAFFDRRRPLYDREASADAAGRVLQILRAHLE